METIDSERIPKEHRKYWKDVLKRIFGSLIPQYYSWDKVDEIMRVLNIIADEKRRVIMFIPEGGNLDFIRPDYSKEHGCIELDPEAGLIVEPKRLTFVSVGEKVEWYYFLLETKDRPKSGIYDKTGPYMELLTEIEPAKYIKYGSLGSNTMIDEQYPKTYRNVSRYFKGNFVFFINTSDYNSIEGRQDMQNKMSPDGFKNLIETLYIQAKGNAKD
jgi:hypothetical protein